MDLVWLVPVTGVLSVVFALWLARDVLGRDTGNAAMQDIAGMIFEGAMAFLRRQYGTIAMLSVVVAVLIAVLVSAVSEGVGGLLGRVQAVPPSSERNTPPSSLAASMSA